MDYFTQSGKPLWGFTENAVDMTLLCLMGGCTRVRMGRGSNFWFEVLCFVGVLYGMLMCGFRLWMCIWSSYGVLFLWFGWGCSVLVLVCWIWGLRGMRWV